MKDKIYKRKVFNDIIKYLEDEVIIVLNGARQVGKTCILYYLKNYLETQGRIVYYIDLEDSRFLRILNNGVDSFISHLKEEGYNLENKCYVLLDEIQYLENPSSFLKTSEIKGNAFLYPGIST